MIYKIIVNGKDIETSKKKMFYEEIVELGNGKIKLVYSILWHKRNGLKGILFANERIKIENGMVFTFKSI